MKINLDFPFKWKKCMTKKNWEKVELAKVFFWLFVQLSSTCFLLMKKNAIFLIFSFSSHFSFAQQKHRQNFPEFKLLSTLYIIFSRKLQFKLFGLKLEFLIYDFNYYGFSPHNFQPRKQVSTLSLSHSFSLWTCDTRTIFISKCVHFVTYME